MPKMASKGYLIDQKSAHKCQKECSDCKMPLQRPPLKLNFKSYSTLPKKKFSSNKKVYLVAVAKKCKKVPKGVPKSKKCLL